MNRRKFIINAALLGIWLQWPLNACKKIIKPDAFGFTTEEDRILDAVLNHLLPGGESRPGAKQINALSHIKSVVADPATRNSTRKLIKAGISECQNLSKNLFKRAFMDLEKDDKENVLRSLEKKNNGKRWISVLLTYSFEALLGDPVYNINDEEAGWKWLNHVPGIPRPTQKNRYYAQSERI